MKKKKLKQEVEMLAEENRELRVALSLLRDAATAALEDVTAVVHSPQLSSTQHGLWGSSGSLFWVDASDARHGLVTAAPGMILLNGRVAMSGSGWFDDQKKNTMVLRSRDEIAKEFGETALRALPDKDQCLLPEPLRVPAPAVYFPLGTLERLERVRTILVQSL